MLCTGRYERTIRSGSSPLGGSFTPRGKMTSKTHIAAVIRFTPHAKVLRELIAERAVFMPFRADGQSDRRGRTHVR